MKDSECADLKLAKLRTALSKYEGAPNFHEIRNLVETIRAVEDFRQRALDKEGLERSRRDRPGSARRLRET